MARRWLLFLVAAAATARASPLIEPRVGGPLFVGPTSAHVTAIFYNPAAAGLLKGLHVYIDGTGRLDYTSVQRATISTADGEPSPQGDRSFPSQSLVGLTPEGFAGLIFDLNRDDLTIGLAIYDPFSDRQPGGGAAFAYHDDGGSFYTTTGTLSASYRVASKLYIGIAANFDFSKVELRFLRDTVLDTCSQPPCGVENPSAAESYHVGTNWSPHVEFDLGLLFRINDWWFGASFRSPICGSGTSPTSNDATVDVISPGGATASASGRVSYRLPCIINVGARRPLSDDWDLIINGRYLGTSAHQGWDLRLFGPAVRDAALPEWIPRYRGFNDVVSLEAGVENPPASQLRLGARARFQTSSVPSSSVASDQFDAPELDLSGGVEVRLSQHVALVGGYTLALFRPVDVSASDFSPRAAIDCNASQHDLITPACAAAREGRAYSSAAGSYLRVGNELTLGVSLDWW